MFDTQTRLKRDLLMVNDQSRWPAWPLLPVKRRVTTPMEHGYLVSQDYLRETTIEGTSDLYNKPATVLVGNIFSMNLATNPRKHYNSFEELFADGWTVD